MAGFRSCFSPFWPFVCVGLHFSCVCAHTSYALTNTNRQYKGRRHCHHVHSFIVIFKMEEAMPLLQDMEAAAATRYLYSNQSHLAFYFVQAYPLCRSQLIQRGGHKFVQNPDRERRHNLGRFCYILLCITTALLFVSAWEAYAGPMSVVAIPTFLLSLLSVCFSFLPNWNSARLV